MGHGRENQPQARYGLTYTFRDSGDRQRFVDVATPDGRPVPWTVYFFPTSESFVNQFLVTIHQGIGAYQRTWTQRFEGVGGGQVMSLHASALCIDAEQIFGGESEMAIGVSQGSLSEWHTSRIVNTSGGGTNVEIPRFAREMRITALSSIGSGSRVIPGALRLEDPNGLTLYVGYPTEWLNWSRVFGSRAVFDNPGSTGQDSVWVEFRGWS